MSEIVKIRCFKSRLTTIAKILGYLLKFDDKFGVHSYQIKNYMVHVDLHMDEMQKKKMSVDEINGLRNSVVDRFGIKVESLKNHFLSIDDVNELEYELHEKFRPKKQSCCGKIM